MALSVIGAGFGRTGTESLKTALEILGSGPCHHMMVVLSDPDLEKYWRVISKLGTADWDEAYAGFKAGVDWPTALYWRELAAHYPEAKVLLTVRDAASWYDSLSRTIVPVLEKLTDPDSIGARMIGETVFEGRIKDRDHAISLFEAHNAAVQAAIPPERLLVIELGEGWDRLCSFLDKPVPREAYPFTNSGEEFNEFFNKRLTKPE